MAEQLAAERVDMRLPAGLDEKVVASERPPTHEGEVGRRDVRKLDEAVAARAHVAAQDFSARACEQFGEVGYQVGNA